MKIKNIFYLLLLIGFASCDLYHEHEPIEIKNYPVDSRTVVSSVIYAGRNSSFLFLSNSQPLFGDSSPWDFIPLTTAHSVIYKNDIPNTNIRFNPNEKNWYVNETFHAGDKVEIEVNNNGQKVSASTVIPEKPVVLSIDTSRIKGDGYDAIRLTIKIKDQPDQKNYYRINVSVEKEIHYTQLGSRYYGRDEYAENNYKQLYSEDLIWKTGKIVPYRQPFTNIHIFNDDSSRNGESIFVLYVDDEFSRISDYYVHWEKYCLRINVQALSEDLYSFYSSLQTGSLNAYSNIQGGLGIFGAVNETEHIVFEKIWQSQE